MFNFKLTYVPPFWNFLKVTLGVGALGALGINAWHRDLRERRDFHRDQVRDLVYFDVAINHQYAGRIIFGLYSQMVPLTCENFLQLCKGFNVGSTSLSYQNSTIHHIQQELYLQGGDLITGKGLSHGMSIYGPRFPDENFAMEFIQEGDLCMATWGPNSNASQFLITLRPLEWCWGKNVVFGTVVKGMKVVRLMGETGLKSGPPILPIKILDCGVWDPSTPVKPEILKMTRYQSLGISRMLMETTQLVG